MKKTIEREVIFYGKDGKPVAKETKTRYENGAPLFSVQYKVGGKWQFTAKGVSDEVRAMVRKYEDRRLTSHMGAVASFTTKDVCALLETAAKERLAISICITPLGELGKDADTSATSPATDRRSGTIKIYEFLSRLEGVVEIGAGKWLAHCPAHDDSVPSMTVSLSDSDMITVECHAGCSPESIVGAMGLKMSDLGGVK